MTEVVITSTIASKVADIADNARHGASSAEVAAQLDRLGPALRTIVERLPGDEAELSVMLSGNIANAMGKTAAASFDNGTGNTDDAPAEDRQGVVAALKVLAWRLWIVSGDEWRRG